ncbi:MAG: rod shape-determining protein MreD [Limnobacter sp.]|nr:rod shape-determining protein MreD [Limnobacter sp.]
MLRPANPWFIASSLAIATLLEMLPLGREWLRPDFLALTLVFWNIHQPRRVGIGLAWVFGVFMDVHSASVFGEHALAYTLLSYFAITIHRRVIWFSPLMQATHILPLLLAAQLVTFSVRLLVGGLNPGFEFFIQSAITAVLWPVLRFVLLVPQQLPESRDQNRPI